VLSGIFLFTQAIGIRDDFLLGGSSIAQSGATKEEPLDQPLPRAVACVRA
jgi:hypothetical protein